jgi:type I restriction enzyme S subunit
MISKDIFSNTYPIKKLGEVVIFLDSKRKPVKESERVTGIYPYYGANGLQGWINDYIFDDELILLAEDGGHFNNPDRGVAYKITGKTWVNNHAHVIKPLEDLNIDYLCRVLENYDLRTWITGTTRAKLTKGGASEILIPLPPLTEQKRIAQILDKADELRQKRQQSIEKLDELLQATFIDMFGDPVTNPKEWEKETIEKVCKQVIDCPHSTPKWTESGEICLRTSNLGKGEWIWDDTRYIDTVQFEERTRRSKLFTGDIVLSREGTIGIAAIVEKDMNLSLGQRLVQLTPNTEIILSEFLLQVLLYDLDPIRITRLMVGSTSKHINVKDLRNLKIFIPPLELQEKWTVFSNKLRQQKQVLKKQLAQQENLFQSLQQRAFNGEL